ncbi:hypothetical protein [Nocardiopsis sp. NPDC006938]|uniref:hypothetical protein n=1 Tax=Nocardiopsis sp. NPDC006938 TaxID=3364337 RepID=UPI0036966D6A
MFACFYGGLVLAAGPLTGAGGLTALWAGYAVAVAGLVVGQTTALVRRLGELRRC